MYKFSYTFLVLNRFGMLDLSPYVMYISPLKTKINLEKRYMSGLTLAVERKELSGSGTARALRRAGRIPAILYGGDKEVMVSLMTKELTKEYLKGGLESKLVTLDFGDSKMRAITRSIQLHPVTDMPLHVDFQEISGDKMVKISIRLKVVNEDKCQGIKRGGVMNMVHRFVEFKCHPDHIVPVIEVDVAGLEIGRSIHIHDLKLSDKLQPTDRSNFVLVSISGRVEDAEGEAAITTPGK